MSNSGIEECKVIQGPVNGEMGMSAAGLIPSKVLRIDNTISAGDFTVYQPVVRVMSENMNANVVGTLFLENFKVTFDAKNKRIQLAGSQEKPLTPQSLRSLGMGLKNKGDNMVVWYVLPESHASKLGIQTDDLVLAVNGKPVQQVFEATDWETILQSNDKLSVQYKSKGDQLAKTANLSIMEILPSADGQ